MLGKSPGCEGLWQGGCEERIDSNSSSLPAGPLCGPIASPVEQTHFQNLPGKTVWRMKRRDHAERWLHGEGSMPLKLILRHI